jgi:hypothetical protein
MTDTPHLDTTPHDTGTIQDFDIAPGRVGIVHKRAEEASAVVERLGRPTRRCPKARTRPANALKEPSRFWGLNVIQSTQWTEAASPTRMTELRWLE